MLHCPLKDPGREAKLLKLQEAKVMEKLLEKKWMVADDKVVFIGKKLDRQELTDSFLACAAK